MNAVAVSGNFLETLGVTPVLGRPVRRGDDAGAPWSIDIAYDVWQRHFQGDPSISDPSWARREGMVAFAGYPLVVKDRLLGVLAMFSQRPLSEAVVQTLGSVAGVIARLQKQWRKEPAGIPPQQTGS